MRIITLDIGNTNPHAGIFENGKLLEIIPLSRYQFKSGDIRLLSRVNDNIKTEYDFNLKNYFRDQQFFNMKVDYSNTLGIDRLVVAREVYNSVKNNEKVLVIDAGTFITFDLVTTEGFIGGYILPGINTFMKIYNEGKELTSFQFSKQDLSKLPKATKEAILNGANYYVRGILNELIKDTSPSRIILTGGSSDIIKKFIDELNLKIELQLDQHLIHFGMLTLFQNHLKR